MCLTAPMKCRADCFCVVAAALRFLSVGTAIAARSTASEPARKMPAARTNGKLGGEGRHYNGCVIIAGARLRNLCAFHRFVLDVTVERPAKSAEGGPSPQPSTLTAHHKPGCPHFPDSPD